MRISFICMGVLYAIASSSCREQSLTRDTRDHSLNRSLCFTQAGIALPLLKTIKLETRNKKPPVSKYRYRRLQYESYSENACLTRRTRFDNISIAIIDIRKYINTVSIATSHCILARGECCCGACRGPTFKCYPPCIIILL